MSALRSFPLLIIPVLIYNAMAAAAGGFSASSSRLDTALAQSFGQIPMPASNTVWSLHAGELVLLIGLIALFFGVISSSRSANSVLWKHGLNMFLFIACLVEFLLFRPFATSTFFLLTSMVFMDTIAGFIITSIASRKDIEMAH